MNFSTYSFRHAEVILTEDEFAYQYAELLNIVKNISDDDIITKHESYANKRPKSLSVAINELLKERFIEAGWESESAIFHDSRYSKGSRWRLDFAKEDISIEVAFNHGEATAWNLIKPVLASELNHVEKNIQTQIGVIITAAQDMKEAGGFDSAVGTYEKFIDYLQPFQNILTVPILLIGLNRPETFEIAHEKDKKGRNHGHIVRV